MDTFTVIFIVICVIIAIPLLEFIVALRTERSIEQKLDEWAILYSYEFVSREFRFFRTGPYPFNFFGGGPGLVYRIQGD